MAVERIEEGAVKDKYINERIALATAIASDKATILDCDAALASNARLRNEKAAEYNIDKANAQNRLTGKKDQLTALKGTVSALYALNSTEEAEYDDAVTEANS